jgi:hypothetical protein
MVRMMCVFQAMIVALATLPALAAEGTPTPGSGIPPVIWQLTKIVPPSAAALTPSDPSLNTLQFLPEEESMSGPIAIAVRAAIASMDLT